VVNRYIDLIAQTFDFPQEGFDVKKGQLYFNDIPLMDLVKKNGTPLRLSYLPKISDNINKAKNIFSKVFKELNYPSKYHYSYCTKSSHFSFIVKKALENGVHLELSSAFDVDLALKLYDQKHITKDTYIICNGFKREAYVTNIIKLLEQGFKNVIPIIDTKEELKEFTSNTNAKLNIGIRIASEEEPDYEFYTSRLGINAKDIIPFYKEHIQANSNIKLNMLHFFISTGIKDDANYWSELNKTIDLYCQLKKLCPELNAINIGGGFPIRNSLGFDYDYEYIVKEIVSQIQSKCNNKKVPCPDIFTEFGNYTVGESGALFFKVLRQKKQNDNETWNMIDGSLMNSLPDTWGMNVRYILLPLNHWENEYERVNIGGLSCDGQDYYNSEVHLNQLYLPKITNGEPLYVGFFHTGAYQEALGGFGGIKHCLIPDPKYVVIDKQNGKLTTKIFAEEQTANSMLNHLGY